MGHYLTKPVLHKHSTDDDDDRLIYGASAMQGWRAKMEDAHTTTLSLEETEIPFFGVYDGYLGQKAAELCASQLHKRIAAEDAFKNGDYAKAIKNGFLGTDADLRQDPDILDCGCTAVVAIIEPGKRVVVGNAGDSRTIISVNGKVEALSYDHRPSDKIETERILAAGGKISDNRVYCEGTGDVKLAMSRSMGYFKLKANPDLGPEQQMSSPEPDIIEHRLGVDEEFIVLACDGIWNFIPPQEVVDFVRRGIVDKKPLVVICEELINFTLYHHKGSDNMTVIIVGLLNGSTKEQWYNTISERAQQSSMEPVDWMKKKRNNLFDYYASI